MEAQIDRLLPEVLRRSGYATAGLSTNPWLLEHTGFATGFEKWEPIRSERLGGFGMGGWRARAHWDRACARADVDDGAGAAEALMSRWVESGPDRPFFWFVNLLECHAPYLPPRPYNDLSFLERVRVAEEARRYLTTHALWSACAGRSTVPEGALARMRHLYARAIRLMDDWLERLLEGLDRQGILEDTLVIVTSDHGENFGEGGMMAHNFSLDERLTHVPLIVAGPGAPEFDGMLSLAELPRRIASVAGIDEHPWRETLPPGVAVSQFDALSSADDPLVDVVAVDWGLGDGAAELLTTPLTAATDGRHKLVRRGDRHELYDLVEDPLESGPLPLDDPAHGVAAPLLAALEHSAVQAVADPPVHAPPPAAALPDDEVKHLEDQMRLLGYL